MYLLQRDYAHDVTLMDYQIDHFHLVYLRNHFPVNISFVNDNDNNSNLRSTTSLH